MKERQIKIYGFDRDSISNGIISSEDLENKIVTLPDCFFLKAYECYKGISLQDGDLIVDIIKIVLPKDEESAKKEWDTGLQLGETMFYAWFATTNGMKVETKSGKCETIFVTAELKDFITEFENLISLGKFEEIEKSGKEICINKDILSRISLGLTATQIAGNMPDIIVLPQAHYHLVKDYKTVKKKYITEIDEDGKEEKTVDYELEDYHHDGDIDVFDGGGIATPEVFEQIQHELKLNYPVEFAIIRGYGIGIKGMITKFDMLGYLDEFYKEDTEFCKFENGKYFLKDYWNKWRKVTKKTMLLNESMVKLAKYYDTDKGQNWYTYLNLLERIDDKYAPIVGKLYVSKVNKNPMDVSEYRRLNYQLLTALALSKQDYFKLLQEDMRVYKKILRPFDKDADKDEWIANIDYIRLFFKNVVAGETDEELEEDIKTLNTNVVTKCEELLNISENFVKLKYVKKQLAKLIEKRCRDLACGKVTVKARYQYIGICPISYMNYAMTRTQGTNGLQTGQFYNHDCENGDIRTIARNPLCAYSEVHNVSFVKNKLLDKYLSHCKEIIYFNQQSDILALMSSADCDGDACTVIDNNIIKEAVVVPADGKYFWNMDDGHKKTMQYNSENKFLATYRASGNLIGRIALKSARVNGDSQLSRPYYDVINKRFAGLSDIEIQGEKEDLSHDKKDAIKEQKLKIKDTKIESGEWVKSWKVPEEHKSLMRQRFGENELDIYIVLYNAMVSIDAPKTLYFPQDEDMKVIEDKYRKKAYFLQYKEDKNDVEGSQYTKPIGLLDRASGYVESTLLNAIDENRKSFEENVELLQKLLINGSYDVEQFESCQQEINNLYDGYTAARKKIDYEKSKGMKELFRERHERLEVGCWDYYDDEAFEYHKKQIRDNAYLKYKELDKNYVVKAEEITSGYTDFTVANVIGCMKRCREDFIVNLFTPLLIVMNETAKQKRYYFQKVAESQEDDVQYLYEYYRKIPAEPRNNKKIVEGIYREEKYRMQLIELNNDIRARVMSEDAIEKLQNILGLDGFMQCKIEVEEGKVFLLFESERIFEVFPDFYQIGKYSLLNATEIRIDVIKNVASTGKSLTMVTTSITINQ